MLDKTPDIPILDYAVIGKEFESLLEATVNKLDRSWPEKWRHIPGANLLVEASLRITKNTYHSVRYLCAQEPKDSARKVEYALTVSPILRSLVDTVFLLVFLFENLEAQVMWYYRGGWREWAEELERYQRLYSSDPAWQEWLEEFSRGLEGARVEFGITPEEAAEPRKKLTYWPTPAGMLKSGKLSPNNQLFLEYLVDWYYRSLSSHAHLSLPGLVLRSAALFPSQDSQDEETRVWRVEKQRSDAVATTIVLCLAIMSEVDAACHFELCERLRFIWGILNGYFGMAKELYERRYGELLG